MRERVVKQTADISNQTDESHNEAEPYDPRLELRQKAIEGNTQAARKARPRTEEHDTHCHCDATFHPLSPCCCTEKHPCITTSRERYGLSDSRLFRIQWASPR